MRLPEFPPPGSLVALLPAQAKPYAAAVRMIVDLRPVRVVSVVSLVAGLLAAGAVGISAPAAAATGVSPTSSGHATVIAASSRGRSPALRDVTPHVTRGVGHPALLPPASPSSQQPNGPVGHVQTGIRAGAAFSAPQQNFEGIGHSIAGYDGGGTPPDENSDVSATQIVEVVNTSFAVFSKTGTRLAGPFDTNQLFTTLTGACQTDNDGDGVVRYDSMAHRWFITQFAIPTVYGNPGPNYQCVAVSTTDDATGSYNVYAFPDNVGFPDYGKFGVWPDGYYGTFNEFSTDESSYLGPVTCVYNRTAMLAGAAATEQCFNLPSYYFSLLPADVDGPNPPPTGTPEYLLALGNYYSGTNLDYWQLHVDWTTPANSTLVAQPAIPVDRYYGACYSYSRNQCIPEPSGGQTLESLGDRLMFPLSYRNYGGDGMLTVSHSINAGSTTGERWYELEVAPNNAITVAQQGTFAPSDSQYRFMGSIAADHAGDLALGYSTSSSASDPDIRYTGQVAGDPVGVMTQAEQTIHSGTGYETSYGRWGDYTSMDVDPSDDCTFWYTNEYYTPGVAYYDWNTRIASFRDTDCGSGEFGMSLSPNSGSTVGGQASSTVHTALTGGSPGTVKLSVLGLPSGATANFGSPSISAGGSSTLTVDAGTAAPGTYRLVVVGQSPAARHSVEYDLTITNDFSVSVTPSSGTATAPGTLSATVQTTRVSGTNGSLALSVSGAPAGATVSLGSSSVVTGGTTTLNIDPGTAPAGSYPITVSATDTRSGGATHTATYQLTIAHGFAIGLNPTSATATAPGTVTATVSTTATFGGAAHLALTATGLPSGGSTSFTPATVTAGDSSTMNIDPGTLASGEYPITVTATDTTDSSTTASADFTLTVGHGFSVSLSRSSGVVGSSGSADATLSSAVTLGSPAELNLSLTGAPSGLTVTGLGGALTAGDSRTVSFSAGTAAPGTYPLRITATDAADDTNSHSVTYTLTVDTAPPTVALTAPGQLVALHKKAALRWTTHDDNGPVAGVDVRVRTAPVAAGFGTWKSPASLRGLTGGGVTVSGLAEGSTSCFEVRATDAAGNTSAWSAQRCVATPLDDRALTASKGWRRRTGAGYYDRTVTSLAAHAAKDRTLVARAARADRVGVVATRCPSCGSLRISLAGKVLGTVSLRGKAAAHHVFLLPKSAVRRGRLTLSTVSSGRPAAVDAVVIGQV